jgi:signal transduction histidine kinase
MRFWLAALPWRSFCARTFTAALAIALLLATLGQSQAADPQPKRVLMLHSFGLRFKPWTDYAEAIRSEISRKSKTPVDYHDHSLLNARLGADQSDDPFVDYLDAVYSKVAPDLIIAFGAPAASFVQQHRERLFPGKPMLFTAIEGRRVQRDKLTENDTVVATHNDFAAAFENLLHVLPDTKTIVIVNGVSPNEKFWEGELRRELAQFSDRVELKWFTDLSFEAILKNTANLPPHTAIFWHLMNVDAAGVTHEQNAALNRLTSSANAPTFSFLDVFFGDGLLGGSMQSVKEGSELAAAVALRVLGGEKAGDITTPPTESALPKYDWRQMQRWGIAKSNLPPGSTIYFREPTVWERYSWQIALITTVILLQAGLIAALLREHRRRRVAEVQSRQRMAELAHVNRFSTAGELTASIAHEINQPLGSILTNAETAQAILKSQSPDIAELPDIVELKDIVNDILQDDRRAAEVIRRMRSLLKKAPFELKNFDLNDVVRETIGFLSSLAVGRKFELTSVVTPNALPILGDRIQLQQVILNLVVNGIDAMRDTPSENRIISIRTSRVDNFAQLSVSDLGPGIPEDKLKEVFEPFFSSKAEGMGMGLSIARTIIEAHHGLIWAKNRDHGGATFRIRLPLVR